MILLLFLAVRMPLFIQRPAKAFYHIVKPANPQVAILSS